MVNGARQKQMKNKPAAYMVTAINVNIMTRSLVQTAFLGLQKAVDHVQKQLSEISQKIFLKYRLNQVKEKKLPALGIEPGSLVP
jgi:hypothetical protein